MVDWVLRVATGRATIVALVGFAIGSTLLFQFGPYADVKALLSGASLPEEAITTPHRLSDALAAMGAPGRQSYLRFQAWDVLNPILIGALGMLLTGWLVRRAGSVESPWRFSLLVPVVAAVADLLENVVLVLAVRAFPDAIATTVALPVVTAAKFSALMGTMLLVAFLAGRLGWNTVSRSRAG